MVKPKKRDKPLTRDEIFEHALKIVDKEGLGALTMRRLAEDVGVEAASLYHHVPNKDALIDGMLVLMRKEIRVPDPLPEDWMDLMEAIFVEYGRNLANHPNMMPFAGRRAKTDPQQGLLFLTQLGFSDEDAVDLWQSIVGFTVGFAVFQSAYTETDVTDLTPGLAERMSRWDGKTYRRTVRMLLRGYDEARKAS